MDFPFDAIQSLPKTQIPFSWSPHTLSLFLVTKQQPVYEYSFYRKRTWKSNKDF